MKKLTTRQIFAQMLKRLRKDKGISRKKLAEDIGVSVASIGYYENEDRAPDIEVLVKLADYFNVSCDELLKGVKSPNENIFKDLWISDSALKNLHKLKEMEPINPDTHTSRLFEFFDDLISEPEFRLIMKYLYRYAIGYDGGIELHEDLNKASDEALALFDEFLGCNERIRYPYLYWYNMYAVMELLTNFAKSYNYTNLHEYEYYMADKIDQICNSKTVKETPDNGNDNKKDE